jgi:hypothetical protein
MRESSEGAPLPERARHLRHVKAGADREQELFQSALSRFVGPEPVNTARRLREQLTARQVAILESVEEDRATFRDLFVEHAEASERYELVWRRTRPAIAIGLVVVGLTWALTRSLQADASPHVGDYILSMAVAFSVLATLAVVSPLRSLLLSPFLELQEARQRQGAVAADLEAAETLFVDALARVGFSEEARRLRNQEASALASRNPPMSGSGAGERAALAVDGRLRPISAQNLVEAYRGGAEVETETRARLRERIAVVGGASIGIAGPRGVGKSTVIKSLFCSAACRRGSLCHRGFSSSPL